ncbi:MAG: transcriptional regulator, ArsR family [Pseudomonadota bacterium]|jgi:DNA-binding transcriptional ArsR family regulator
MDNESAVRALQALAHEHRLAIFRLLVRHGPNPVPAGEIARAIGISPTATSFHLKELDRAGLVYSTREGRYIRYAVHIESMRAFLAFLAEDCCEGRPELCGSDVSRAGASCKPSPKSATRR